MIQLTSANKESGADSGLPHITHQHLLMALTAPDHSQGLPPSGLAVQKKPLWFVLFLRAGVGN